MKRTVRLLVVLGFGLLASRVSADDGALPRGRTPAPGHKLVVPDTVSIAEAPDCASYIANPAAGELFFTPDGKFLYFLSRQPGETGPEGKAFLYEADLENLRSKRIVSLRIGDNAALVGHGNPLEALTVMDFHRARVGCGEGLASGVGIKWIGKQKIIKSYPQGNYKVVTTDQGPIVADMDQRNIKILDLNTFQKRTLTLFPDKFYPLFVRAAPLQFVGYKPDTNELVKYEDQDGEPVAVLKLKKGMRLVQENEQFGIVTSSEDGHILQVKQIKGWSGDAFRGIDIRLPEGFTADRVGVDVDFPSGLCLVQGASQALKRELRQVMVYSGGKTQNERIFKANEGQYYSQAVFAQKGRKILLLARSLADESIQSLRIGDVASSEWKDVAVTRDGDKPAEKEKPATEKPAEKGPEKTEAKVEKKPAVEKGPERTEAKLEKEKKLSD